MCVKLPPRDLKSSPCLLHPHKHLYLWSNHRTKNAQWSFLLPFIASVCWSGYIVINCIINTNHINKIENFSSTRVAFGLCPRLDFLHFKLLLFLGPAFGVLFMGHEQCIKAYEQCFLVWIVTKNYIFIVFNFQQNKWYSNAPFSALIKLDIDHLS